MRALASDFDGTIFFEDGFRDEDLKQIQAYKKQGNMFGICTGRPLADLQRDMTKSLDLDFYIVLPNTNCYFGDYISIFL